MMRLGRLFGGICIAFLLLAAGVIWATDPMPYSRPDIETFVSGLNEAAAIGVPHDDLMREEDRQANLGLLTKVEQGEELDTSESAIYRRLFQKVLQENQVFLSRFDGELTILDGIGPDLANNCFGNGIDGRHDHHDLSARRNFAGVLASLEGLEKAYSTVSRIRHANAAYKDLVDLVSHLGVAPHTVSIAYVSPETPWPDAVLGDNFEDMLASYKNAQFLPVNSQAYWHAIAKAEAAYVSLILAVQDRVLASTTPIERRIAGRFLSPQTLAPPVDLDRPLRKHGMESKP